MAHYAFLDDDNKVVEVITGIDEDNTSELPEGFANWEEWYADFKGMTCKRTSYNTRGGVHITGGTPYRKNYAGIGYTYDEQRDAFIPPKPFNSWVLNETTCLWDAPTAMPTDDKQYSWNEDTTSWVEVA